MMRIITGKARGTKLKTLEGEATRPTSERCKEALFSMLQFDIEGRRVLDLFAGSGQMGLEALSRGAESAVLVDKSPDAVKIIQENALKCKLYPSCEIRRSDYLDYIKRNRGEKFDIIFLDPPYHKGLIYEAMSLIINKNLCSDNCMFVAESDSSEEIIIPEGFMAVKEKIYGRVKVMIIKRSNI